MQLADLFLTHAPEGTAADAASLERALEWLVRSGQGAFPTLRLSAEELVTHAAQHLPAGLAAEKVPAAIESLHAADLFLACACAKGTPAALAVFDERHLAPQLLRTAVGRVDRSPAFADEVRQLVREKLFLGSADKPPRIAEYSGRGALSAWVRVVAVRVALDLRPSAARETTSIPADTAAITTEPELRVLKNRYGKLFEEAVAAAFAALDDEQCNLLRLQLVDGLRTSQIAALFNVDRSTIKRRLAACRDQLSRESQRLLREKLKLSPDELESLAGLVQSQLQVSVERLLKR